MKGRTPTTREKEWMAAARETGCIVCSEFLGVDTPAAIHHIDGKTKPDAHYMTIPLCGKHHQEKDNHRPKRWISRHGDGRIAFEDEYGCESELLSLTLAAVGTLEGNKI